MIRFDQVHKQFGSHVVLRDVSFTVERGETVVIVGFSGAGKSVCLRHMVRLEGADSGLVEVDGQAIDLLNRREMRVLRSRFGVLFQGAALLQWMNLFDNVALPLRERTSLGEAEIAKRVEERLEWVGLLDAAERLPAEVSGGMQKRAGLARAMVMDPEILLYDEPTSGLDPVTSRSIDELMLRTNRERGATSVVVTHDLISALAVGSRILMLHEGQVVEYCTPEAFVKSEVKVVQDFLAAQQITG
ncbi:MAG: ATP-binding cassette domain-containing protein [Kiritimatiellaceae bacterium]|nr:MAG: ATP-binding cassette domain-containing protein [Kiritimatiellaceae bacterium]|tara:strand:+ start:3268 stop:4002 length:735 start_codon:yes stop_codon:yes gene_type:complete